MRRLNLPALIAGLLMLTAFSQSYGTNYESEVVFAGGLQTTASSVSGGDLVDSDPVGIERCRRFQRQIGVVTQSAPSGDSSSHFFGVPSITEKAREFQRVRALDYRQTQCERRERQRAKRRAALTDCARALSEKYEVSLPMRAPMEVKAVMCAANEIDTTPYVWGGGHDSFESSGYDCSGAVSFALHGGGFLESPLDSTGLETWGEPGPGHWITVYANSGHAWMIVAGLAFDTVDGPGPRWHPSPVSSTEGFVVRHPSRY